MKSTTCVAVAPLPLQRATAPPPSTRCIKRAHLKLDLIALRVSALRAVSGARRTNTNREKTRENIA